jgi:hypothetical protein
VVPTGEDGLLPEAGFDPPVEEGPCVLPSLRPEEKTPKPLVRHPITSAVTRTSTRINAGNRTRGAWRCAGRRAGGRAEGGLCMVGCMVSANADERATVQR